MNMLIRNFIIFLLPCFVCCDAKWYFYRNDYSLNKDTNYWVKLNPVPAKWHDARKKCELEGAVLASPFNSQMLSTLQSALKENQLEAAYIGLHSTFSDSDWQSIEGIPLEDMKLNKIIHICQDADDKCAVIESKNIVSVNCSEKFPFVCYKDANEVPRFTECGTNDPEYKLDLRTGSCYKFHTESATWSQAFEVCRAEGGYLAIIDNSTKVEAITDLFKNISHNDIKSAYKDVAHIGLRDWLQNGEWYTVHGEAFNKKTHIALWDNGEPNNSGHNEYCAGIFRKGRLNDVTCNSKLAFICEKDPKSLAITEQIQSTSAKTIVNLTAEQNIS